LKEEEGMSWFGELALPYAIMRLKQGVGRLIRTRTDRGIVAILDPRLTSKAYGRAILSCLPPMQITRSLAGANCIDDLLP
jgi:ATP-dependent DNA helicase DinG